MGDFKIGFTALCQAHLIMQHKGDNRV